MDIFCLFLLFLYFIPINYVNFSGNPDYYVTDMYSDMTYAMEAWKQKTIFPDGWVFGNQLYAVATPVLAAVFYGLTNDPVVAMAIASTVMGIGVLFSFNWMLKPVFPTSRERLIGMVIFVSLVLFSGNMVYSTKGCQLFFTMCSYYACYAIAAFLAFGCFLRSDRDWTVSRAAALLLACIMSFGTGIQSLRQTAVMVCPLIAVEAVRIIRRAIHKEKIINQSWIVTGMIAASNLSGVLYAGMKDVAQTEIFGSMKLIDPSEALSQVPAGLSNAFSLLVPDRNTGAMIFPAVYILAVLLAFYMLKEAKNQKAVICLILFCVSIAVVLAVEIFTTMYIRNIYYFLLFPLISLLLASFYSCSTVIVRGLITALLVIVFAFNYTHRLSPDVQNYGQNTVYEEVVDYLEENHITTVFSGWNRGEKIGIASDWRIKAGFWDSRNTPFVCVKYLCDPSVFDAEASQSAYIFFAESEAAIAVEEAGRMNVDFTLAKYFPASNIYVFTSEVNLMQLFSMEDR